jgi:hypothetical protein
MKIAARKRIDLSPNGRWSIATSNSQGQQAKSETAEQTSTHRVDLRPETALMGGKCSQPTMHSVSPTG